MKQAAHKHLRKVAFGVLSIGSIFTFIGTGGATDLGDKEIKEQYNISSGIYFQNERYKKGTVNQSVNVMKVDLSDPHTDLKLNIPDPLNQLRTTTSQAMANHTYEARVAGAINASFFENTGTFRGFPANLLLENGRILRFGRNSPDASGYNYRSQAFGMMPDGKAAIDEHTPEVAMTVNGETHDIFGIDLNGRQLDQMVMFTPNFFQDRPGTSESSFATELVVREVDSDMTNLTFGQEITGVVTERNTFRDPVNSFIPDDGFVLSANGGTWAEKLADIEVGDEITVSLDIEDQWKQADYVMGTGPFLVRDGQRHITMDETSSQARTRAPRTAVGISADGQEVFLVTADGRQSGYANGMTITELADYMIGLGAHRAINLDGGGSTTMVAQQPGLGFPSLVNQPSDGFERGVSTTLQVIDSTPYPAVGETAVELSAMETADGWRTAVIQANASLVSTAQTNAPKRQGQPGVQLNYDFSVSNGGTAAAYMRPHTPFKMYGSPEQIGLWVYGDANAHWLRGNVYDGRGNRYTVNFTAEGGLNWTGWRYVRANLPANIAGPVSLEQIYLVEPVADKHGSGRIIIDSIETIYDSSYHVDRFTDLTSGHWAFTSVMRLNDRNVITGHTDGSFQPNGSITREQAATMLVRELGLSIDNRPAPGFEDVNQSRPLYPMIAAAVNEGLLVGSSDGKFHPGESLTRAELATILVRAYRLSGRADVSFSDVSDTHWAFGNIERLVANGLTSGYPDGTFRPNADVTRAEFSTFMDNVTQ